MPALSTHAINTRFRRRSHERRHADRPSAWAARTGFAKTIRAHGWQNTFSLARRIMRDNELAVRSTIYFAAVCRCFPGKAAGGTDRVPSSIEIGNCSWWMSDEFEILRPRLVIPVGRLAIAQFVPFEKLGDVVGKKFALHLDRHRFDLIPLPHPSGASPWHKIPPGKQLLEKAMRKIARHPAIHALSR
jgi:uracil-DNA glycosylase family 4